MRSASTSLLRRSPEFRLAVIGLLMLACFGLLVGKLWYVQVARGAEYTARIRGTSQVNVRLPAVRGEILDRHGVPLAVNRSSAVVEFYLPDLVRQYRDTRGEIPRHTYRTTVGGMMTEKDEPDIVKIVNDTVMPLLAKFGIDRKINEEQLRLHYRNETEVPYTFMEDLDFETLAKFAEHNAELPGVEVNMRPVRRYVYGASGAHFLGYVGAPNEVDQEEAAQFTFYQSDVEGKTQIELKLNDDLRGQPGARILQRDAKGRIQGEIAREEPKPGHNVHLTIDARIQHIAEKALRVVGRGAAVVVDPSNGDILAMASVPSFDPNSFIPSIKADEWNALTSDRTNPLMNRATSGYAPGSTYKVVPALAGLRKAMSGRSFTCSGGVKYGRHMLKCTGTHGTIGLGSALRTSCNAYFCLYGNNAGIEEIVAVGEMLGLGQRSGAPLTGENAGILPGPEWLSKQNLREQWSTGQTANTSIGQGFVLASPLQMAMVAATVANWGTSYYPRMVDKVVARDGTLVRKEPVKIRANLLENGISVEDFEKVRRGLWDVVNRGGGTAPGARIKNYEVAGKTGTAQFWRRGVPDNHVWFIAFAPYDKPRYAVSVMVNGGASGGGVAAPIASKILADIFKMEEGESIEVARLDPAKGSFGYVSSVNFGRAIPAALAAAPPGERSGEASSGTSSSTRTATASTVRRAEAATPEKKPNLFQRLFGKRKKQGG
ncbi:MAG: penicillin-binding protein 2 [Chthoniobacterales bacterium]